MMSLVELLAMTLLVLALALVLRQMAKMMLGQMV
jgi:hypothetical protein